MHVRLRTQKVYAWLGDDSWGSIRCVATTQHRTPDRRRSPGEGGHGELVVFLRPES